MGCSFLRQLVGAYSRHYQALQMILNLYALGLPFSSGRQMGSFPVEGGVIL